MLTFCEAIATFTPLLSNQIKLKLFLGYCILILIIYVIGILSQLFSLEKSIERQNKKITQLQTENQKLKENLTEVNNENKKLEENKNGLAQQVDIYKNRITSLMQEIQEKEYIRVIMVNNLPDALVSKIENKIKLYESGKIRKDTSNNENS